MIEVLALPKGDGRQPFWMRKNRKRKKKRGPFVITDPFQSWLRDRGRPWKTHYKHLAEAYAAFQKVKENLPPVLCRTFATRRINFSTAAFDGLALQLFGVFLCTGKGFKVDGRKLLKPQGLGVSLEDVSRLQASQGSAGGDEDQSCLSFASLSRWKLGQRIFQAAKSSSAAQDRANLATEAVLLDILDAGIHLDDLDATSLFPCVFKLYYSYLLDLGVRKLKEALEGGGDGVKDWLGDWLDKHLGAGKGSNSEEKPLKKLKSNRSRSVRRSRTVVVGAMATGLGLLRSLFGTAGADGYHPYESLGPRASQCFENSPDYVAAQWKASLEQLLENDVLSTFTDTIAYVFGITRKDAAKAWQGTPQKRRGSDGGVKLIWTKPSVSEMASWTGSFVKKSRGGKEEVVQLPIGEKMMRFIDNHAPLRKVMAEGVACCSFQHGWLLDSALQKLHFLHANRFWRTDEAAKQHCPLPRGHSRLYDAKAVQMLPNTKRSTRAYIFDKKAIIGIGLNQQGFLRFFTDIVSKKNRCWRELVSRSEDDGATLVDWLTHECKVSQDLLRQLDLSELSRLLGCSTLCQSWAEKLGEHHKPPPLPFHHFLSAEVQRRVLGLEPECSLVPPDTPPLKESGDKSFGSVFRSDGSSLSIPIVTLRNVTASDRNGAKIQQRSPKYATSSLPSWSPPPERKSPWKTASDFTRGVPGVYKMATVAGVWQTMGGLPSKVIGLDPGKTDICMTTCGFISKPNKDGAPVTNISHPSAHQEARDVERRRYQRQRKGLGTDEIEGPPLPPKGRQPKTAFFLSPHLPNVSSSSFYSNTRKRSRRSIGKESEEVSGWSGRRKRAAGFVPTRVQDAEEKYSAERSDWIRGPQTQESWKSLVESWVRHDGLLRGFYGSRDACHARWRKKRDKESVWSGIARRVSDNPTDVIAFGWNYRGTRALKGDLCGSSPVKGLVDHLSKSRRIVLVNEHNTSKLCSVCWSSDPLTHPKIAERVKLEAITKRSRFRKLIPVKRTVMTLDERLARLDPDGGLRRVLRRTFPRDIKKWTAQHREDKRAQDALHLAAETDEKLKEVINIEKRRDDVVRNKLVHHTTSWKLVICSHCKTLRDRNLNAATNLLYVGVTGLLYGARPVHLCSERYQGAWILYDEPPDIGDFYNPSRLKAVIRSVSKASRWTLREIVELNDWKKRKRQGHAELEGSFAKRKFKLEKATPYRQGTGKVARNQAIRELEERKGRVTSSPLTRSQKRAASTRPMAKKPTPTVTMPTPVPPNTSAAGPRTRSQLKAAKTRGAHSGTCPPSTPKRRRVTSSISHGHDPSTSPASPHPPPRRQRIRAAESTTSLPSSNLRGEAAAHQPINCTHTDVPSVFQRLSGTTSKDWS